MHRSVRACFHKYRDTIQYMITLIIISSITIGLVKMAEKSIKDYDYGHISIEEFKHTHKDSSFFK